MNWGWRGNETEKLGLFLSGMLAEGLFISASFLTQDDVPRAFFLIQGQDGIITFPFNFK